MDEAILKRLNAAIDEGLLRAIYGDRYGCNPPPTNFSLKRKPRRFQREGGIGIPMS